MEREQLRYEWTEAAASAAEWAVASATANCHDNREDE